MLRVLLIFLFSLNVCYAMPKHIELWFLSIDKSSWLNNVIEKPYIFSKQVAYRSLQCQQMGEYCFDPQVGLYKRGEEGKVVEELDMADIQTTEKYDFMDPHKGVGRELIECDENPGFFDVFCGKAKRAKSKKAVKLELWIDTSSTMKQVDFGGLGDECHRERFLNRLSQTCTFKEKMKVHYYTESRKEAGSFDRVCLSAGLNNMKRIISDMKKSTVDNLIIITDIFEADVTFINAIESTGRAVIRGLDKPIYASNLNDQLQRVRKLCR